MKQVKIIVTLLFLMIIGSVEGQTSDTLLENEVNEQVWRPFKESYEKRDATLFNSLHTDDVLRIGQSGIRIGDEYKSNIKKWYASKNQQAVTIDFSHEYRSYNGAVGYEVGYYRVIHKVNGAVVKTSYGRFHVVLVKIEERWKIAQDWDTEQVGSVSITEEFFEGATFLNLNE